MSTEPALRLLVAADQEVIRISQRDGNQLLQLQAACSATAEETRLGGSQAGGGMGSAVRLGVTGKPIRQASDDLPVMRRSKGPAVGGPPEIVALAIAGSQRHLNRMPGWRRQHAGDDLQSLGGEEVVLGMHQELVPQDLCDQAEGTDFAQLRQALESSTGHAGSCPARGSQRQL